MRRQRIAAVVAGVIVLATGAVVLSEVGRENRPPTRARSSPARTDVQAAAPGKARPLTYAEGQRIHLGTRTIETHMDLLSLDVTDDGAAFTTFDGGLWFTDGSTVTRIGLTSPARVTRTGVAWGPAGRPEGRIVSGSTGSHLAWLEYPRIDGHFDRPEIVVYDTHLRRRVARVPIASSLVCAVCAQIVSVHDDTVYWTATPGKALLRSDHNQGAALSRYQVSTRRQSRVMVRAYQAELRRGPRTMVVGDSLTSGVVGDGIGEDFAFVGGVLVVHALGQEQATFDPVTGRRLLLRPPPRFDNDLGPAGRLYPFEWLDDHSFALLDATGRTTGSYRGQNILVCSTSTSNCTVAVPRPPSAGSPIVPGFETAGSELARNRAARAQLAQR